MRRKYTLEIRICPNCGKTFELPRWRKQLHCSIKCIPIGTRRRPIEERLWDKVDKSGNCWLWTGAVNGGGYGHISQAGRRNDRQPAIAVHRLSYELHNGPIPDGLFVLHMCDTPRCVNPAHLFVGTQIDNMQDRAMKGRNPKPMRGEDSPSSKITEKVVIAVRQRFSRGDLTQEQVGELFGISQTTVWRIINRISWSHVE